METKEVQNQKIVTESKKIVSDEQLISKELESLNTDSLTDVLEQSTQRIYKESFIADVRKEHPNLNTNSKVRNYVRKSLYLQIAKKLVTVFIANNKKIAVTKQTSEFKAFAELVNKSLLHSSNRPQFKSKERQNWDNVLKIAFMIFHSK